MKKETLVIGRCWKFLDFLVPTVDSIIKHNDCCDLVIVDSLSSRSENIESYCKMLLKNEDIHSFITSDDNYFGNIWHINKYLIDLISKYEYICLTDMDLKIINPEKNWINKLTSILERNPNIGAVSGDFEPMPPSSNNFSFTKDYPEKKMHGEDFWDISPDGWFYTVRSSEFLTFIKTGGRSGQFGPGMHGYNEFCSEIGKKVGRTNLIFFHYGWLRFCSEEWDSSYSEMGMKFSDTNGGSLKDCNQRFLSLQGNWSNSVKIPTKNSFTINTKDNQEICVNFTHMDKQINMHVYNNDYISNIIKWNKIFYEKEILDDIQLKYPKHKTIIDIGSNIGNHAVYFENFLSYEKLFCFEPDKNNFELLCKNKTKDNTIVYNIAISNKDGFSSLNKPQDDKSYSNFGHYGICEGNDVKVITLDSLNLKDVTLIKLDVEHHELQVLQGARSTILRCKPIIYMEINSEDAVLYLLNLGYEKGKEYKIDAKLFEFIPL